jgi:predicted DNA-binding transcriptional regulator AlpA
MSKELSKIEAANYLGVSRATFDNYINNGWIPKGNKRIGFKELSWNKCDLDKFIKRDA